MNFNKFRSFPVTFYTTFGFGNPQKKLERVDWEKYIWSALLSQLPLWPNFGEVEDDGWIDFPQYFAEIIGSSQILRVFTLEQMFLEIKGLWSHFATPALLFLLFLCW